MSRSPSPRPALPPALPRVWRDACRVQLGTDPDRAVVLEFGEPRCAAVLELLDGTRTETGLIRAAAGHGVAPDEVRTVLATLRSAELLVDARTLLWRTPPDGAPPELDSETAALVLRRAPTAGAIMRRRSAAGAVVTGAAHLAVPIASALGTAGVGHLDVRGVSGAGDVTAVVRKAAPHTTVGMLRGRRSTTVAVVVGLTAPAALTALSYAVRKLTHLVVNVRDGTVVVGPLVQPGSTPCLACLDLHRLDRDPDWHTVCAQLHTSAALPVPVTATTTLAAAAYAAEEVLIHIDGGNPTTVGATVEVSAPGRIARREWGQHPRCGCRRRGRSPPASPPVPTSECFN
jgi:bacteriocin biosynthesis cyclodehydratase domain-containing protein